MSCYRSLGDIWPDDLYFVVPASGGGYVDAGGQIITLPDAFSGWKVRVARNNIPVDNGEQVSGDPYFEQNLESNFLNIVPDATEGDKFMIQAYKPVK